MAEYTIDVKAAAREDLLQLKDYLKGNFSDEVAEKVTQKVILSYSMLEEFPQKGKNAGDLIDLLQGYYYLPLKQNIIFYKVKEEERLIEILRIFSTQEDFIQKFIDSFKEEN